MPGVGRPHGGGRAGRRRRSAARGPVAALATLALAVACAVAPALAAPARALATEFPDHLVEASLPKGTRLDLYDYWLQDRTSPDWGQNPPGYRDWGINAGHNLRFVLRAAGETRINSTYGGAPVTGIVQPTLGEDGYPRLAEAYGGESLAYLFDGDDVSSGQPGKLAFPDVGGLLVTDGTGVYSYSSRRNFASFDPESRSILVYDTWGVRASRSLSSNHDGQFFPFDAPSTVLEDAGGALVQRDVTPTSSNLDPATTNSGTLNHWFGMVMTSEFIQTDPSSDRSAFFRLTGDDDIWLFVDGVLVGDLGGIHGARSVSLDLRTGEVATFMDSNGDGVWQQGETRYDTPSAGTLRARFRMAGREGDASWDGETFAPGTTHTLKLYYLERGSGASSLASLSTSLEPVPDPAPAVPLALEKRLVGRDIEDGLFSAVVTPVDSDTASAREAADRVGAGEGGVTVPFPAATRGDDGVAVSEATLDLGAALTASDVGKTFRYEVREQVPEQPPAGYSYDGTTYVLEVSATRDDGAVVATETLADPSGAVVTRTARAAAPADPVVATFRNSYEARPAELSLRATKVLSGRALVAGEFSFELLEGDEVVATATNDAGGVVEFPAITYDEPGEHDYRMVEVAGDEPGMSYDDAEPTVHVSVTKDAAAAELRATATYGGAAGAIFRNAYVPAPGPDPDPTPGRDPSPRDGQGPRPRPAAATPETGDPAGPAAAVALAGVACLALALAAARQSPGR